MTIKFRSSITSYASLSDGKKILDELIEDLQQELNSETYEQMVTLLQAKKDELDERYNRFR